jgi:site-specific recombinase XerD
MRIRPGLPTKASTPESNDLQVSTAKPPVEVLCQDKVMCMYVGIHSLPHSFATNLLDRGTVIKYLKDLLGHFNMKTIEPYLHVTSKQWCR